MDNVDIKGQKEKCEMNDKKEARWTSKKHKQRTNKTSKIKTEGERLHLGRNEAFYDILIEFFFLTRLTNQPLKSFAIYEEHNVVYELN